MSDELIACPFCGIVGCQAGCINLCDGYILIEDFNRRPIEDALRVEIARLKDVIRMVEFVNSYSDDTMCAWCGELEHTPDCPRQKALA